MAKNKETLRIFISYSSEDKLLAGQIKTGLDLYGFNTFLAHEDIDFGTEWENQILRELKNCSIFIPILSAAFKESNWTSQEVGIAIELQKKILPLSLGVIPFGFIHKIQATKINGKSIYQIVDKIIDHLKDDEEYSDGLINTVIKGLVDSNSFDSANARAKTLKKFDSFNHNQVTNIARGYLENNQISGGFDSRGIVEKIIKNNKNKISGKILAKIKL